MVRMGWACRCLAKRCSLVCDEVERAAAEYPCFRLACRNKSLLFDGLSNLHTAPCRVDKQ